SNEGSAIAGCPVSSHFALLALLVITSPPPPRSTLFPYTTLFRSRRPEAHDPRHHDDVHAQEDLDQEQVLEVHEVDDVVDFVDFEDRKSTRLNSSHVSISYGVFCLTTKTAHRGSMPWNTSYTRGAR